MATAFISTSAELVLLNTTTRAGVVILPSTTTIPGRILTFKDTRGTFGTNPITFSTAAANQSLENNAIRLTYNDPFGSYSFLAGYDNKWYTIGGSRMYAASISSITTISLTSQAISSGNITVSTLQFRDTATTSTNTLFSLSTNVYYSSPVSFFSIGPTKAPKSLFTPIRGPFLPNQISGLQLWVDSQDSNTFSLINNTVTAWRDKSGLANNGVGTGSIAYTQAAINNLSAMSFNNSWFTGSFKTANTGNAVQIFAAVNYQDANFARILSLAQPGANDYDNNSYIFLYRNNTNSIMIRRNTAALGYNVATATSGSYVPFLVQASFVGPVASIGLNGTLTPASANTGLVANYNITSYAIAQDTNTGDPIGYLIGFIGEVIYYSNSLTTAQIQQVEGYLAWKWNLVGNLPSTHPFKNSPP